MTFKLSRRAVLLGAAASTGTAVLAEAPSRVPRPLRRGVAPVASPVIDNALERLVANANLGGAVGFVLADAATGTVLSSRQPGRSLPPASTMKAVTSIYALDRLGADFKFKTRLLARGVVKNGILNGDLILAGGGDPTLDTDRLADLARSLRDSGVFEVTGRFLVWADAYPRADMIDPDQPQHVAYNPSFCGLNLNFNRVHFEWKPNQDGFDVTMQARGLRFSPNSQVAHMDVIDRPSPIFDYRRGNDRDKWSVARKALGKKEGARWLPVRFPAIYTADIFKTLARANGIVLKSPELIDKPPTGPILAESHSEELGPMLQSMMRYSTNLTAEMTGLTASMSNGVPVGGLLASGSRMAGWAETKFGARGMKLRDHSGLGYGSAMSAQDMVNIIQQNQHIESLMRPFRFPDPRGTSNQQMSGARASAKTGTLNFVSSLAGFMESRNGRKAAFAIFTADTMRRDAIPVDQRERPQGSRSWSRRSRGLQRSLLGHWARMLDRA